MKENINMLAIYSAPANMISLFFYVYARFSRILRLFFFDDRFKSASYSHFLTHSFFLRLLPNIYTKSAAINQKANSNKKFSFQILSYCFLLAGFFPSKKISFPYEKIYSNQLAQSLALSFLINIFSLK